MGLWIQETTEIVLGEVLSQYMMDQHVIASLKDAIQVIVSRVFLLQTQNINLLTTIERTIAPTLLKSL